MKYTVRYPNTYDAYDLLARQSAMPSQHMRMVNDAYYPLYPLGVSSGGDTAAPPEMESYVVYTYDTRPPAAQDIVVDVPFTDLEPLLFTGFTVPNGNIFILRKIEFELYPSTDNVDEILGITGKPLFILTATVQVNGISVLGYVNIDIADAEIGRASVEAFIAVNQGDTITITTNLADVLFTTFTPAVRFYGNLLRATGRSVSIEYTSPEPVPVEVK